MKSKLKYPLHLSVYLTVKINLKIHPARFIRQISDKLWWLTKMKKEPAEAKDGWWLVLMTRRLFVRGKCFLWWSWQWKELPPTSAWLGTVDPQMLEILAVFQESLYQLSKCYLSGGVFKNGRVQRVGLQIDLFWSSNWAHTCSLSTKPNGRELEGVLHALTQ